MSERLRRVVDRLDLRPATACWRSAAATAWRPRWCASVDARLTAIDRSPKMIEAAARRNAAYVDAGTAEFLVATSRTLDLGDRRFDKIFAVRVGLFHREPERARQLAERWLAPGGILVTEYD